MSVQNDFSQLNHAVGSVEPPVARDDRLLATAREFVGVTFYGMLMREFRNYAVNKDTPLSPKRAEKAFTALMDEDALVRVAAVQAIQGLEGIKELSDILHQLLEHEHIPTRRAAIQALSLQPQTDSFECFLTVLHDEDPQVRQHAAVALQELTGELLHQRPEAWRWWFEQQLT